MASITTNKKEIVDFLWQWAESQGDWGKLLVDIIVKTEDSLTKTDLERVFNYFLQSVGLLNGLSEIDLKKPIYTPTNKKIELSSISDIEGVNKLAKSQEIIFSKNLTVIYGENGTGKSSYGRILKAVGFSYDTNNIIYHNVFNEPEAKSARINFRVDEDEEVFIWNGANKNNNLSNISVFNSRCVQISLSDRQLIVSPVGFHLFNLVSSQLDELAVLLRNKINSYQTSISWSSSLSIGTPQQEYINRLSSLSTEEELTKLSSFTNIHTIKLRDKKVELSGLNRDLFQTKINNLQLQIKEIEDIIQKINKANSVVNVFNFQKLKEYEDKLTDLRSRKQKGLKEIAKISGIKFYSSIEFQSFIEAAEQYIKTIENDTYPNERDHCVYCLQPLEAPATELLSSYRVILNDKTQQEIEQINNLKEAIINKFKQIDLELKFRHPIFGFDENQNPKQPIDIIEYNNLISSFVTGVLSNEAERILPSENNFKKYLDLFIEERDSLNNALESNKNDLRNIVTKEQALKMGIAELEDRKLLSEKIEEIKACIANEKIIETLKSQINCFNTRAISLKTSQAREELIKQNFTTCFQKELKSFRKSHLKIDLNFATSKGSSKVTQKVSSHILTDILSEGEQKAIALAEFLTEIQLDNIKAPVIFDDPVNSLDHNIIDEVARRMIKLSNERQIIIFTHSVLLFNNFLYSCNLPLNKKVAVKFYNLKSEFGETGIVSEAEEEINKVRIYIGKVNALINNTPKDRSESDIASDGYGYLRSAIELCVEHEIFQGTVKRYQKNIALTSFMKVNGSKLNEHKEKLNEIFERCCSFIKGHSNPIEIHNDPTIAELKEDFNDFKSIRDEFIK